MASTTKAGAQAAAKSAKSVSTDTTTTETSGSTLDQDMFLQLLIEQMSNQDPLDPMSNEDMLAQLAQFSSLEQMNELNENFETFSGNIDQLNFISAGSLVGHEVSGVTDAGDWVEGTVAGVRLDGSIVYLVIGEEMLSMAGVQTIG
ncbi:MAG: flagellar hook capping protein [Candidatus Hydrogenedentes bacterium]|nr:flagellar hook capping protein [Candidatus Hydrogenedentota bacterium]